MKFSTILATFTTIAVAVSAAPGETNAQRMARGLPPLPPVRRATRIGHAKRSTPSGTPYSGTPSQSSGSCSSGSVHCCNSVGNSTEPLVQSLSSLLGVVLGSSDSVGVGCSPLGAGNTCTQQTVCCENNNFNGLIAIGCTPININL